ncbi:MAG: Spy/CpxP family protein refolding chaperone [Armatimonadota bacterium]
MKRLIMGVWILLGILTVWATQPAVAQAGSKNAKFNTWIQRRAQRLEGVAKWLQLTDAQKTKIKGIWENARQQAQKIRDDTSLKPDEKRARLRDLWRNTRQEIGSVLTPEQRAKWWRLRLWAWHRWQMARAFRAGKIAKALGFPQAQEKALLRLLRQAREARRRIW